jgi:hypothetical protein
MNLPSITGMSKKNIEDANRIKDELLKRFEVSNLRAVGSKIFDELKSDMGITMNRYSGRLKPGIEISEFELSMVLDSGFSYFGGSSTIMPGQRFDVTIYTD